MVLQAFGFAFSAVVVWSVAAMIEKKAAVKIGRFITQAVIVGGGIIPTIIYFLYSGGSIAGVVPISLAIGAGILFGVAGILYYKSLETERLTNAYATGLIQPVIIIIFSVLVLSETITPLAIAGGVAIFAGSFFVSTNKRNRFNWGLFPAFVANLMWGGWWVLLSLSVTYSGQLAGPITVARSVGFAVALFLLWFFYPKSKRIGAHNTRLWGILAIGVIGGILDGLGNLLNGYLIVLRFLYVGGIIWVLAPCIVAVLAYFVYKDRLTKVQAMGLIVAIAGAVVVALA